MTRPSAGARPSRFSEAASAARSSISEAGRGMKSPTPARVASRKKGRSPLRTSGLYSPDDEATRGSQLSRGVENQSLLSDVQEDHMWLDPTGTPQSVGHRRGRLDTMRGFGPTFRKLSSIAARMSASGCTTRTRGKKISSTQHTDLTADRHDQKRASPWSPMPSASRRSRRAARLEGWPGMRPDMVRGSLGRHPKSATLRARTRLGM